MTKMSYAIGMVLSILLAVGNVLAADPADIEKFVKARIEIGAAIVARHHGLQHIVVARDQREFDVGHRAAARIGAGESG